MAAAKRKPVVKNLRGQRQPLCLRGEIFRREQGWNDRFAIDQQSTCNKTHMPASSSKLSIPSTPPAKGPSTRNERAQQCKVGGKRNFESKKLSSGKLLPLVNSLKPSTKVEQTKEEKLRFNVLKAIDSRETLLYQLNALILCTPVVKPPSRHTDPSLTHNASQQQMLSKGGINLASTRLNRSRCNTNFVTNSREAVRTAQQLATDLQLTGIICVEALVEWMLEVGAQSAYPPPFLWRGRNYFLKMYNDLDSAEAALQARGINLDCFRQHNPLLIKPKERLGRVLAAHSIIIEMVQFAKDPTPIELLALRGQMQNTHCYETERTESNVNHLTYFMTGLQGIHDKKNNTEQQAMMLKSDHKTEQLLGNNGRKSAAGLVYLPDEILDFTDELDLRHVDLTQGRSNLTNKSRLERGDHDKTSEGEPSKTDVRSHASGLSITENDIVEDKRVTKNGAMHTFGALVNDDASCRTRNQFENTDHYFDGEICDSGLNLNEMPESQPILGPPAPDLHNFNTKTFADECLQKTEFEMFGMVNEASVSAEKCFSRSRSSFDLPEHVNYLHADSTDFDFKTDKKKLSADVQQTQDILIETGVTSESVENRFNRQTNDEGGSECADSFDETASEIAINCNSSDQLTLLAVDHEFEDKPVNSCNSGTPDLQQAKRSTDCEGKQILIENFQKMSKLLEHELKRWSFLEDENRPIQVNLQSCLAWQNTSVLRECLRRHSSISECMEGSILSMLDQYGFSVPDTHLIKLLCSDVAQDLDLATHLINECHVVLGDICAVLADNIQKLLGLKTSLVSEIEFEEVIKIAEAARTEFHHSTWDYVKISTTLIIFLNSSDNTTKASQVSQSSVSSELSQLLKVFYPYVVNEPRDRLNKNWDAVSKILVAMGLPTDCLYVMLDPLCKTLLLVVNICSAPTQDCLNDDANYVFPRLTVICDREDILQSSVEYVWRHHLVLESDNPNISIFPYFKCSFGDKVVNGFNVEEGEGKGPLKEWFTLVGAQLASKWKILPASKVLAEADSIKITTHENVVTIPGASDDIYPGIKLEWKTSEGDTVCRVVNKCVGGGDFLLDRVGSSYSLMATQLIISQPCIALFEYVRGSESYWLNENTRNSPESQDALVFLGWFLACAVTHFCSIQLRIHPLFFRLLLNSQHCVSLEELKNFDPQLFQSLSGVRNMKPSNFADLLKLEGYEDNLSAEDYICTVLERKFGPTSEIGWQLQFVRSGFDRVIDRDQLNCLGITETDLSDCVCGSRFNPNEDFVINDIFRIATDNDLSHCPPMMNAFWHTVNSFEPTLKRKFIKFVTGVDTLPLAGTEFLRIEMPFIATSSNDHVRYLQMLPQAHTCDNTLEMPHYWKALCWRERHNENEANDQLEGELMLLINKKLRDAVEYSSGYGLDNASAVGGVFKTSIGDSHLVLKEESYDSMGLPTLSDLSSESSLPPLQTPRLLQMEEDVSKLDDKAVELTTALISDEVYDEYDDWEEESVA
ncbi:ubiquitin-protein ligase [Plasmopara halstedii]|uniref:HECT-type E3 ubiquitin transferase n=1 Tax=Plasmopara halstedii TaxID=4781 RepID=A0A0P1A4Y4_PLAHL|nr:ubiquitin-protein ligase [Plasmopara halstedii]CEG35410.1 ubiquitin-protein ligase [Plasmopara halstedii]|eukprot:XP_024571779.1 ubiquitin-protein ligase [Plasmopara halstedii]